MVRWSVGATKGVACADIMKVTIGMGGAIPFMGGKDEVRGGNGFHDVIIAIEYGVTRGRETPSHGYLTHHHEKKGSHAHRHGG